MRVQVAGPPRAAAVASPCPSPSHVRRAVRAGAWGRAAAVTSRALGGGARRRVAALVAIAAVAAAVETVVGLGPRLIDAASASTPAPAPAVALEGETPACGPASVLVEGPQAGDGGAAWEDADGWIDEAFVTFFDLGAADLAEAVVAGVHLFSSRPLVAYCAGGCEVPWPAERYPRLVRRAMPYAPRSVFFNKLQAVGLARVRHGVLVEADSIPNYRVDDLFDTARRHAHLVYPLLPRHVQDPHNQAPYMREGVTKTVPYGHAHLLWGERALPFLARVHEACLSGRFDGANYDETAINVMLWERGATVQACMYDTHWSKADGAYARQRDGLGPTETTPYNGWAEPGQEGGHRYAAYHLVHGNKDADRAWELLALLKRERDRGSRVYVRDAEWFEKGGRASGWLLPSSTCVL